ncbi:MAG: hypothetical protein AAGA85_21775 [Bacteroidota bacterium]
MIYLTIKQRGLKVWGALVAYNAMGAFDYVHGLMAQWTDPLVPNGMMGTPALTYGSIGFSLVVQLVVVYLVFRPQVMNYCSGSAPDQAFFDPTRTGWVASGLSTNSLIDFEA